MSKHFTVQRFKILIEPFHFLFPFLLCDKRSGTNNEDGFDSAASLHFPQNQTCFDGFTNAYTVCNQ